VLALLQLVQNVQYMRKRTLIFARPKYLFEVVLRDSIWYFAFVICIDVATVIIWQRTSGSVESGSQWTNGLLVPFFAFVSSRLNFDLRELNRRKVEGEDVSDVIGVSGEGSENPTGIAFVSDVRESVILGEFELRPVASRPGSDLRSRVVNGRTELHYKRVNFDKKYSPTIKPI